MEEDNDLNDRLIGADLGEPAQPVKRMKKKKKKAKKQKAEPVAESLPMEEVDLREEVRQINT